MPQLWSPTLALSGVGMRTRLDFQNYLDSGWELSNVQIGNSFGSCQEKKIFPFHHAPDRLGNAFAPIKGDPDRGPGAYNHAERNNLIYNLAQRPQSTKGYSMGARTTPRFVIINKHLTPAPTTYQSIWIKEHKHKTSHFPFLSNVPRFLEQVQDREFFPGYCFSFLKLKTDY